MCEIHKIRKRKNCINCFPNVDTEVDAPIAIEPVTDNTTEDLLSTALTRFKEQIDEMSNIKWEHLHVPMFIFRIELLRALEQEGWEYCEMIKDPARYNYTDMEDFCILKRIKRSSNPPIPNLLNSTTYQKYFRKGTKK